MSSKLGTTLTHNNISTFDEGDSFVYYNLSGPARPNTINFGLYNSSNTQIIIGTLPLEGDVIYNPANAQTIDGFFQFENQDGEYSNQITYFFNAFESATYNGDVYRQFEDQSILFSEIGTNENPNPSQYTNYILHVGNEWMRIINNSSIFVGGLGGADVYDEEDNEYAPVTHLTEMIVLEVERGVLGSSAVNHLYGETVELWLPFEDWSITEKEQFVSSQLMESIFIDEININFGVPNVIVKPTLFDTYDPYSGINILSGDFISRYVEDSLTVHVNTNLAVFKLGVNTDNRVYQYFSDPLFLNADGSLNTNIAIKSISLSGDFDDDNESVSVQIGGDDNTDLSTVEFSNEAMSTGQRGPTPIEVFGPSRGHTPYSISPISNGDNYGSIFISLDKRSNVGGSWMEESSAEDESETGNDMTITISFIDTTIGDEDSILTMTEAANLSSPRVTTSFGMTFPPSLFLDFDGFTTYQNGPNLVYIDGQKKFWEFSCSTPNGTPSPPIQWINKTPDETCFEFSSVEFNTYDYWNLINFDKRPSLGCFNFKEDNISKDNFESDVLTDNKFIQFPKVNMVTNGSGRIAQVHPGSYYQDNPSFGENAYLPYGGWDYIRLDGVGYRLGFQVVDTGTQLLPAPDAIENSYIQSSNYSTYHPNQILDNIYGYAGYFPYPFTNLNRHYQWASWQESGECYSHGRCLMFQASPEFWIDPSTSNGLPGFGGMGSYNGEFTQDEVLNIVPNNQYRTINQYQKIYSGGSADDGEGTLTPYSSLKVSFWMKTINDNYYNSDNPPEVEATILNTDPGETEDVYTERGFLLANQGGIDDLPDNVIFSQTFVTPNPYAESYEGLIINQSNLPADFEGFNMYDILGTELTEDTFNWQNVAGDYSADSGQPAVQPPYFYYDEYTLNRFCEIMFPPSIYGAVRANMDLSTSTEFNVFQYGQMFSVDSDIYPTDWMRYSVPRYIYYGGAGDTITGAWTYYEDFTYNFSYFFLEGNNFPNFNNPLTDYTSEFIVNYQNGGNVTVANSIVCEVISSTDSTLIGSTILNDTAGSSNKLDNADNTTIITTFGQHLFENNGNQTYFDSNGEGYSVPLDAGQESFNELEIFNDLFNSVNMRDNLINGLLNDSHVYEHHSNINPNTTRYIENDDFFLENGEVAKNIVLTKIRISGDYAGSSDYTIMRLGNHDEYQWTNTRVGSNPNIHTQVTDNYGDTISTTEGTWKEWFHATNGSQFYSTGRTHRDIGPIPINPIEDGAQFGQVKFNYNASSEQEQESSIGGTDFSVEFTFQKVNYNFNFMNNYYIRIGEDWDYEYIKVVGTELLQDINGDNIIRNTTMGNEAQWMGEITTDYGGVMKINVERGVAGTTARAHSPQEPVKIYLGYPPDPGFGAAQSAATDIEIFHSSKFLSQPGRFNSITTTVNTNNSYNLGSMARFRNNSVNVWEHKQFSFNLTNNHTQNDTVGDLFFAIQAGNNFGGTVYIDNMEVRESYEFRPDCDVRKKISAGVYGVGDLTEYYDPTIPEQFEAFNDTTAPLEVQFYFYPRYKIENFLNSNSPSYPIYNDFRNGLFYIHDLNWGDGSPLEYRDEPLQLGDDIAIHHTYEFSGIFEVTGIMLRIKPSPIDSSEMSVIHSQLFTLRINVNEGLDEDFEYFGSDGFSFIPYKNTTPTIGGYSEQSIYYKSTKRQLGILSEEITLDTKFKKESDKLKTQIALNRMDSSFNSDFDLLNAFKAQRTSEQGGSGDVVYSGLTTFEEELGKSIGDTDVTNIRYFNKPMQIWEMLGFKDSVFNFDNAQGHPGNPSSPRYWKKIIPKDYSIFERDGINPSTGLLTLNIEQANHEQNWRLSGLYRYPVLPKYGADGKFIEGVYPGGFEPFPLTGPITDENYMDENLKISITTKDVELNVLDDISGNNNYGFTYGDYKPNFDNETLEPKKVKNTTPIKTSQTRGAF